MKNKTTMKNFTQVPNVILDNENLRWDEKAVLITFFRNKSDWKAYKKEFIERSKDGRKVIDRIFESLEDLKFIVKKVEGGERNNKGYFTKSDVYYILSNYSLSLIEKENQSSETPVKTSTDPKRATGYGLPKTDGGIRASNNTNLNNTNQTIQKEIIHNNSVISIDPINLDSVREETKENILETETDSSFIYLKEENIEVIIEEGKQKESYSILDRIPPVAFPSIENNVQEQILETETEVSTSSYFSKANNNINIKPTMKTSFTFKPFEKPGFHQLEEYFHSNGYSSNQANEFYKRMLNSDYKDSSGQQIKYFDSFIKQEFLKLKPEGDDDKLIQLSKTLADGFTIQIEDETERMQKTSINRTVSKTLISDLYKKYKLEKTEKLVQYFIKNIDGYENIGSIRKFLIQNDKL